MGRDIIIAAKKGDQGSMNLVLEEYTPLIHFFAWQREDKLYYDDYIQVGMMGLLKAIKRTSPEAGGSFTSYAASYIKNEMALLTCKIRDLKWNDYLLLAKYYKKRQEIEQRIQNEVDMYDVLDEMKLQPSMVDIIKTHVRKQLVSIDANQLTPRSLESEIEVNALESLKDGRIKFISEMVAQLSERQAYLVNRHYLQGHTQVRIANDLSVSVAYVGSALYKIRNKLRRKWPHKLFQIAFESEKFYDPEYSFHQEKWKHIKSIDTTFMVSNYGRVMSYNRIENKFVIKYPNKDKDSRRYRLNDSGKMVTIPVTKIITMHFETEQLPTFYEK